MNLTEQIFAQAVLLCGSVDSRQEALLRLLCGCAASTLQARLRSGITPQDCKADFIAAASLYALAALSEVDDAVQPESFTAGDVTVRRGSSNAASRCLRSQAELMITPYLKDGFSFRGV